MHGPLTAKAAERIFPVLLIPRGARLVASLAAVLSGLVAGAWPEQVSAQSYKAEYKLSTAVGPAYPWGKGAEIWAQLVKERTAGRIIIKQFPGASAVAGDTAREFAALRDGTIDLAVGSSINWAAQVRALNLFALPFMVGDNKALDALLHGEVGAAVLHAVEEAGVVPLAWGDNDFREISTAQRALRRPEELAGLRIRASGSPLADEVLAALGAVPVRMKWLYAQNAMLERGLDGQETTAQAFVATKAYTLGQKQFTLWAVAADPLVFAVSRAAWEAWAAEDREIVREAAVEAAGREIALARRAAATAEAAMVREPNSAGVIITRLTPDERAAFAAATRAVFDKWAAEVGVDLVKRAQDAILASRQP
jgi:TRAP-type C4-dicarboxylate transport system substrate-binding protein